jgi:hypothetical protein
MLLHGSALVIVVAIDQVVAFARRVAALTGDVELAEATRRFDAVAPDVEALRDLIAHHEAYAVGEGWRQTGRRTPPINERHLATFNYWIEADSVFTFGSEQLTLKRAVDAASALAEVVERVRAQHEERAAEEANAALRRRHGLPLE